MNKEKLMMIGKVALICTACIMVYHFGLQAYNKKQASKSATTSPDPNAKAFAPSTTPTAPATDAGATA